MSSETTGRKTIWFVNLNDTDTAYVRADTQEQACDRAITAWADQNGFQEQDDEYQELRANGVVEVREEPRLATLVFEPASLVHFGMAYWTCAICDAQIESGGDWSFKGTYGFCEECMYDTERTELVPYGKVGDVILLSTEF